MNESERQAKIETISRLQAKIAKLTKKLGKEIRSIEGERYTAEVVTSNIYQALGVNGYSNRYNGDVEQVLEDLRDIDVDDDNDEIAPFAQPPVYGEGHYDVATVLPKIVYDVATPFIAMGKTIDAVKAIRAETDWYLSEALHAKNIVQSFMNREAQS